MYRLLLTLIMALIFQSCQVAEDVASSKQVAQNNFPGATLTTVLSPNGWKKLGDDIDVSLIFPLPICVTGMPYINAQVGFSTRRFYYYSGNGTQNIIFRYTVNGGDLDSDGISFSPLVTLNGGSLTYSPSENQIANIGTSLVIPSSLIKVDGIPPYLSQVVGPNAGNYATGQQLKYYISYSEKVFVSGAPSFNINLSSGVVPATYKSGSGSSTLEFSKLLAALDIDADGFTSGTLLNLNPFSGITITDEAGNTAPSGIFAIASTSALINVIQPTITSITPPANATYILGQQLNFTVNFSEAVNVIGTPSLNISLTTGSVLATYISGSGTSSLIFRYTVASNHIDSNGITLVSPMLLNGGTIKNLAGTQSAALLFSVPVTTGVLIDAATGPYVTSVTKPADGLYLESQNLDFKLKFNRLVNVTGSPRLPVIVGSTTLYADYLLGSGTDELTFRYTTSTLDEDFDGISLSSPIDLNAGVIEDINNKAAILNYVPASTVGIKVDGSSPSINNITWTGTGTLKQNQHLNFTVQFSEVVTVTGAPSLSIIVGATSYNASYISGSGTNILSFRYIIQNNDTDTDGVEINSPLVLNAGTIKDLRGHDSSLIFADPIFTTGYTVDAVVPTVTAFNAPVDRTYKIGDNLDFVVNWSEPTFVSGLPRIVLTVGATTAYASFVPGLSTSTSTSTSFTFRYTVPVGHLDTDGIATSGITLNGGQIKDAIGNNASLAAAAPVLTGVLVDGVVPYVTSITVPANATYKEGQVLTFGITWSENVTIVGSPHLKLILGSTQLSSSFTSTGPNTADFSYTVLSGQLDTDGITVLSSIFLGPGITIKDTAGNDSYLQINLPPLTGVKVDAIVPTILALVPPDNATYKLYENVDFKVLWSESIIITGSPRIAITVGGTSTYATYYAAGSTATNSIFRYNVSNGHLDNDGISAAATIDLNGGTIRDAATNDAVLTYTLPDLSGVLVDGVKANIDPGNPLTPPANGTYGAGANLDIAVNWTENVTITGSPYIRLIIGSSLRLAYYFSGSGTPNIVFRYTILPGESDTNGISVYSPVYLNGGTIKDVATNDAYLTFSPSFRNYPAILVDAVAPYVSSSTSTNLTVGSRPDYFKLSETIQYNLTFNETVTVTGVPRLVLNIGGNTRYATYNSGSGSNILSFRFTMDAGDALLDLDGISVDTTIDMNGGTIRDAANNLSAGVLTFSGKDYVYYANTVARYHIADSDFTTASCYGSSQCITSVKDISGSNNNLSASSPGPEYSSGFGSNSTSYMQFNSSTQLTTTTAMSIRYVIFVMKTVSNASTTGSTSYHKILNRKSNQYGSYTSAIRFTSNSSTKAILMSPSQKLKINGGSFSPSYTGSESAPTLWVPNTTYIMAFELSAATTFYYGSILGGSEFNGQIAEVIFLSGTITEAKIDQIRDQLNAIHGAY
jgi:hypothetical protein